MFLRNISLLYLIGIFFGPIAAFGGSCFCGYPGNDCSTNQHCVETWFWDDEAQMMDNDFYCEDCPAGYGHSETDCFECVPCAGYNDACPNYLADHIRCKDLGAGCPNGCHKYGRCDSRNGNILDDLVDGPCHTEGETCYSNTRACSMFVVDHFVVGWNCDQWAQVGNAEWRPLENAWDTKNCTCSVVDRDIVHIVGGVAADGHCIAANSDFYVTDADRYRTASVNDHVRYSFRRRFCRQCEPGYLPTPLSSPDDGIILRPENTSGNWGVVMCNEQVSAPDYAPGCVIDFNLSADDMMAECRKQCPTGFETESNGATSINFCVSQYSQTYEDSTGFFVLTSFETCP